MRRAALLGLSAISVALCVLSAVPAHADGPELGANVGAAPVAFFFAGQGGYYCDLSDALKDKGPGYNIQSGINFDVGADNKIGFFGRYDVAYMRPEFRDGSQRKMVSGGLAYTHVFEPP